MNRFRPHAAVLPIHRTARQIDRDTALVSEIAEGKVVRQYQRDIRTFSDGQRHAIGVAAVTASEIRL